MNIILDMDDTLIYSDFFMRIYPRPYLEEFLSFCFTNFKNVSIWTAAHNIWFEKVNKEIFSPILSKLNKNFDFVFTATKCSIILKYDEFMGNVLIKEKRLLKLHKSKKYLEYNLNNMIIIDDTPTTFSKNYGNGVKIKEFNGNPHDTELIKLMTYLEKILIPYFNKNNTVRTLEKRFWINDINDINDEE